MQKLLASGKPQPWAGLILIKKSQVLEPCFKDWQTEWVLEQEFNELQENTLFRGWLETRADFAVYLANPTDVLL